LEEAYPVRFVGSGVGDIDTAAAVIVFPGGRRPARLPLPCLVLAAQGAEPQIGSAFSVEMARCAEVDRALRGQRLTEHDSKPPAPLRLDGGRRVLAVAAGKPVWVTSEPGGIHTSVASAVPSELGDREFLRDHLVAGRFWSLLPLVHFLKRICYGASDSEEVRRACFIIDDPNLRSSSYGYVSFPGLAADAHLYGYHVAVATIPLDLLLPGHRAAKVFRAHRSELSLAVHGNDHSRRELERRRSVAGTERMVRSAVARVERFEERVGLRVDRVMCPPHGGCSDRTLDILGGHGFLGLAASRPFPWDGFKGHRRWRLGGWLPAQLTAGGCPVIPRISLSANLDDLALRALLGIPLIMYCHHEDVRGGLEPFRAAADRVAALGEVEWSSLASIARRNAHCHERDGVATVTLFSRDVRLRTPTAPVVRVEVPRMYGSGRALELTVNGVSLPAAMRPDGGASVTLAERPQGIELRITMAPTGHGSPATVRDWRPRAWPVARRAMTEARDRTLPLVRGVRGSVSPPSAPRAR
jgi:hypothetical protein